VTNVSKVETVPNKGVSTDSFDYDQSGQVTANIVTLALGTGVQQADDSTSLAVTQPGLPAPGIKTFAASPAKTPFATGFILYPFTSAYNVFSGNCVGASPVNFAPDTPATALLGPGGSATVTVIEPSVNVLVKVNGVVAVGASVKATNRTCGASANLTYTNATVAGRLPKPGMPYGTYDLCASGLVAGVLRREVKTNVLNRAKAGTADQVFDLTAADTAGACP
jgi:hypothetical protein